LLDVLRAAHTPVPKSELDAVWADRAQRDRCLDSLLMDGLAEQTTDGRFALGGSTPMGENGSQASTLGKG
jgi:A/G-specific adenine glycosylase